MAAPKHGDFGTPEARRHAAYGSRIEETPVAGVKRRRAISLLERWEADGTITAAMHDAAKALEAAAHRAGFRARYAQGRYGHVSAGLSEDGAIAAEAAGRRVSDALRAIGPIAAPHVIDVVILGFSMTDHAQRYRMGTGRPCDERMVKGVIVGALGVLAERRR